MATSSTSDLSTDWSRFSRPTPEWFLDAKLGIFIHWGAYSVPAWAEPVGELGAVDPAEWFAHNPYAEWYWNTIRIEDSPAARHHRATYGDLGYDAFLDRWQAEHFDPSDWVARFVAAGARYVVPTSKHHDGIALWEAPGSGARNTVRRGPRRDLIGAIHDAARAAGMRFGVYYSGGLDWSVADLPPIRSSGDVRGVRPNDAAYATYCAAQVRDLIDRYHPEVLWNDIEWPDAGKHPWSFGLAELFEHYYARVPEGVVNDRFGDTHHDYRTSEYQMHRENEAAPVWEHNRGLGFSFGYNQLEDERHWISPPELIAHFVDVVSRGGNLLLNVGPMADGTLPAGQCERLDALGAWNRSEGAALFGSRPLAEEVATPGDDPWVRWVRRGEEAWAFTAGSNVVLPIRHEALRGEVARLADGTERALRRVDGGVELEVPHGVGVLRGISLPLAGGTGSAPSR